MIKKFLKKRRAVSDGRRRKWPTAWPLLIFMQMGAISTAVELGSFALCKFVIFARFSSEAFDWFLFHYDVADGGAAAFLAFAVSYVLSAVTSFILQRKRTFQANNNASKSAIMYIGLVWVSYLFSLWVPPYVMPLTKLVFKGGLADVVNRFLVGMLVAVLQYPINKFVIMRNKKQVYKAAVFDLDGTLLNTLGDLAAAGNYALEKSGHPTHPVEAYKKFVGSGIPMLVKRMLPEETPAEMFEQVLEDFREYYGKHKADTTAPYEGVLRLLRIMDRRGIPAAVVSNKDDAAAKELVRKYFGPYVTEVLGRRDGVEVKPNPELVYLAMNSIGAEPSSTLYIGDSDVDMQTAINAGLDSCGVLWGFRDEAELREAGAKYLVESVFELGRMFGIR